MSQYVEHMACCLLLVTCALLSIVFPLPSCYPIIVSVAPPVSPSLPSSVSVLSLLVSVALCWSVVCMLNVHSSWPVCSPQILLRFCSSLFYCIIKRDPSFCIWVLAFISPVDSWHIYHIQYHIFILLYISYVVRIIYFNIWNTQFNIKITCLIYKINICI